MDHDEASSPAMGFVIGIRVADVKGEVKAALGVHLMGFYEVESFRDLAVTFAVLGAEGARGGGDGVGAEEGEFSFFFLFYPDFERALFFKGPNEDGCSPFEVFFLEGGF